MSKQLLAGVRVVELAQGIAGPICARNLAFQGAEVVKIESRAHPDITRQYAAPWLEANVPADVLMDTSALVNDFVSGKSSLGLDVTSAPGQEILNELLGWADVFLVNLSSSALDRLGVDEDSVRRRHPDLIYVLISGFGEGGGPYAGYRAWGANQSALGGIDWLTGWPDRPPSGVSTFALPDYLGAGHATVAVLSALLERDATDEGQFIDLSQLESTVAALRPTLMETAANDHEATRTAARLADAIPSGIYACRAPETWVALACETERQWEALHSLLSIARPSTDLDTLKKRREHAAEIDDAIIRWTATRTPAEAAFALQDVGIPAGVVNDSGELLQDIQLDARQFYFPAKQSRFGADLCTGSAIRVDGEPAAFPRAGPCLGEDNDRVLGEILGYKPARRAELVADGAVEPMADPDMTFVRPSMQWVRWLLRRREWTA